MRFPRSSLYFFFLICFPIICFYFLYFKTRIYHCNVDSTGNVSLDILEDNSWSPALTISKMLLALRSIFTNPNPYKPQVPGITHLYLVDRSKHDALSAEWTQRFAK
ncbi:constitutive photomorphogenesis protein 10-like [Lactuca sativa]|uniref:constitutive photomorphogenesis protein 10-like n=1 Tax=Lactuca sativa TaxID=4236 RepID=UPI0022AFBBB9|nr:constitutive photomorphogenesis protein 10-like [Lactuca sativa]